MDSSEEYSEKLAKILHLLRNGKFNECTNSIQQFIIQMDGLLNGKTPSMLDEAMNTLLNEIMVLCFIKLKEFKNARALS